LSTDFFKTSLELSWRRQEAAAAASSSSSKCTGNDIWTSNISVARAFFQKSLGGGQQAEDGGRRAEEAQKQQGKRTRQQQKQQQGIWNVATATNPHLLQNTCQKAGSDCPCPKRPWQ